MVLYHLGDSALRDCVRSSRIDRSERQEITIDGPTRRNAVEVGYCIRRDRLGISPSQKVTDT